MPKLHKIEIEYAINGLNAEYAFRVDVFTGEKLPKRATHTYYVLPKQLADLINDIVLRTEHP